MSGVSRRARRACRAIHVGQVTCSTRHGIGICLRQAEEIPPVGGMSSAWRLVPPVWRAEHACRRSREPTPGPRQNPWRFMQRAVLPILRS